MQAASLLCNEVKSSLREMQAISGAKLIGTDDSDGDEQARICLDNLQTLIYSNKYYSNHTRRKCKHQTHVCHTSLPFLYRNANDSLIAVLNNCTMQFMYRVPGRNGSSV